MKKHIKILFLVTILLYSCAPSQINPPTPTSTQLNTKTPTIRPSPSNTPTEKPTVTRTAVPTRTPRPSATPPLYLSIKKSTVEDGLLGEFGIYDIPDVGGLPATRAFTQDEFCYITMVGSPYLAKVQLSLNFSNEDPPRSVYYLMLFMKVTVNNQPEITQWILDSFPKAQESGRVEKVFSDMKFILQTNTEGTMFYLDIEPAQAQ